MNQKYANAPIGVFDSGVGGLTVAREIMRQLPKEDIVYFGDTARVPYGSKSKDTIIRYAKQIIHFLQTKQVKTIVIACNTASALALDTVRQELDIPIIGVVVPGARVAAETTRNKKIGVIGTEATVSSHIYPQTIHEIDTNIEVVSKACPLFCPLVEEGLAKHPVTMEMIDYYLSSMKGSGIDTLILGCTHYPLLRSRIMEYMGEGITLVNPAYETAMELRDLLQANHLAHASGIDREADYQFFVSDLAEKFRGFANSILPFDVEDTNQINIEEY